MRGSSREKVKTASGAFMSKNQLSYLELPSTNVANLKDFYGSLFGWRFEDFGEDYATVHGAGLEAGFNGDPASKSKAPLPMIETTEIEVMEAKVRDAGGTITMPTFAYPGGRRFHFVDPAGNELAVMEVG
jgi:predicted enzyme related to lactoylglutathione lyase